jgi:hypothetical protein
MNGSSEPARHVGYGNTNASLNLHSTWQPGPKEATRLLSDRNPCISLPPKSSIHNHRLIAHHRRLRPGRLLCGIVPDPNKFNDGSVPFRTFFYGDIDGSEPTGMYQPDRGSYDEGQAQTDLSSSNAGKAPEETSNTNPPESPRTKANNNLSTSSEVMGFRGDIARSEERVIKRTLNRHRRRSKVPPPMPWSVRLISVPEVISTSQQPLDPSVDDETALQSCLSMSSLELILNSEQKKDLSREGNRWRRQKLHMSTRPLAFPSVTLSSTLAEENMDSSGQNSAVSRESGETIALDDDCDSDYLHISETSPAVGASFSQLKSEIEQPNERQGKEKNSNNRSLSSPPKYQPLHKFANASTTLLKKKERREAQTNIGDVSSLSDRVSTILAISKKTPERELSPRRAADVQHDAASDGSSTVEEDDDDDRDQLMPLATVSVTTSLKRPDKRTQRARAINDNITTANSTSLRRPASSRSIARYPAKLTAATHSEDDDITASSESHSGTGVIQCHRLFELPSADEENEDEVVFAAEVSHQEGSPRSERRSGTPRKRSTSQRDVGSSTTGGSDINRLISRRQRSQTNVAVLGNGASPPMLNCSQWDVGSSTTGWSGSDNSYDFFQQQDEVDLAIFRELAESLPFSSSIAPATPEPRDTDSSNSSPEKAHQQQHRNWRTIFSAFQHQSSFEDESFRLDDKNGDSGLFGQNRGAPSTVCIANQKLIPGHGFRDFFGTGTVSPAVQKDSSPNSSVSTASSTVDSDDRDTGQGSLCFVCCSDGNEMVPTDRACIETGCEFDQENFLRKAYLFSRA